MTQLEARRRLLKRPRRIVVKLGSSVVADSRGLKRERIKEIAEEVAEVQGRGTHVVIVSSGAIAAGRSRLGLSRRPRTIAEQQAAAAVGQIRLMAAYESSFSSWGIKVAQVLLTRDDFANRRRYLNAKHTMSMLLRCGIVPVVNENDTVVVAEIKFGDNDNLSALVAALIEADLLVMLSDVDGLYTEDPRSGKEASLVRLVEKLDKEVLDYGTSRSTEVGTGGMASKLQAAATATASGIPVLIANGTRPGSLRAALDPARECGTLILQSTDRLARRKQWIAYTLRPEGTIVADSGASEAVCCRGSSLLPSGISEVVGDFDAGACVSCVDTSGKEFARGLVAYSSSELRRIKGLHSREVTRVLGYKVADEVIHRDDLVLMK